MARTGPRAKTGVKSLATRDRDRQAYEMKLLGATLMVIAKTLGFAGESGAYKAVQRHRLVMLEQWKDTAEEMRLDAERRLTDLHYRTLELFNSPPPVLYKGKPVLDDQGHPVPDQNVQLRAAHELLAQQESYRRLFGIDAPRQVEVSGPEGEPISVEITAQSLIEKLGAYAADAIPTTAVEVPNGNGTHG